MLIKTLKQVFKELRNLDNNVKNWNYHLTEDDKMLVRDISQFLFDYKLTKRDSQKDYNTCLDIVKKLNK